ncbi:MAG: hypothetical protein JXB25_05140 [Deltaproteobacteria bacterium]|nr:hypothetical protein [Deltaproteobacteria bacterium]
MDNLTKKPTIEISFIFDAESGVNSPESWYLSACELIYVQKQLEKNIFQILNEPKIEPINLKEEYVEIALRPLDVLGGFSRIYMYLSGIIFENLTKAIIIQKSPEKLNEITSPRKGHDLSYLIGLCGFELSIEENEIFERISVYIVWAGRYSHPKRKNFDDKKYGEIKFKTEDIDFVKEWISKLNDLANYSVYLEKNR